MMIKATLYLTHMCPACGNYYYENEVSSFNTFGAVRYSDGSLRHCYNPSWITRCPRCMQYLAKDHLFKLPAPVSTEPIFGKPSHKNRYIVDHDSKYGRLGDFISNDKVFYENAIAEGLYFPITVREFEKRNYNILLHRDLWHAYNQHRNQVDDEVYYKHCKTLIGMMEERDWKQDKLYLAELYRNVGDHEKCLALLDEVPPNKNLGKAIERIREEALKENKLTVIVEEY